MVPAVQRAFRVLDLLSRTPAPVGASEVARRLRLAKSTTHGLLRTLVEAGAVEEIHKRYRLGPAIERLAASGELRRRWHPVLERLAREAGETSFLGQPRAGRVAILDEVAGSGPMVVSAPVGSLLPVAGALAGALSGQGPALDRGGYLEGVNAAAVAVPGAVIWVAGFAGRFEGGRLEAAARLLGELT
ncbi:MAG: IclR family transcriptional regulator [Candidatus Dormibacteraceae bacterium]